MKIEEIKADELVVMTKDLHRIFSSNGCNPTCHNCLEFIPIDSSFKLSTIKKLSNPVWGDGLTRAIKVLNEKITSFMWGNSNIAITTKEVMLCENCTPEQYLSKSIKQLKKEVKEMRDRQKGCFRINGKIVHS
jgi:hypothetical protein